MQPDNLTNLSVDGHIPRTIKSTPKIHQPIIQIERKKNTVLQRLRFSEKSEATEERKKYPIYLLNILF